MDIFEAVFTLLPALFAAGIYERVLSKRPIDLSFPPGEILRIAKHIVVAIAVVFVIPATGMAGCPQDANGYCDDDWKPPTSERSMANFLRLSVLTLIGMGWGAYRKHRGKDPPTVRMASARERAISPRRSA